MKYLLIFVALAVSGCTSLDGWEVEMANKICNDRGGVDYIDISLPGVDRVVNCNDGTWLLMSQSKAE